MNRRNFLTRTLPLAAAVPGTVVLGGCGGGDGATQRLTYLLTHGAWHHARHWTSVADALLARGHRVVAIDLPGNGPGAAFPAAYATQDLAALATEVSPLKDVTLQQQADAIVAALRRLAPQGPVVLVAHSAGGLAATLAAEAVPELVVHLVYVAAHCPVALPNMLAYLALPENAAAQLGAVFLGDPAALGAVRINPRAADPAYQEAVRQGFYNDMDLAQATPFLQLLTPDLPLHVALDPVHPSAARWGTVPRTYVRTLRDQALPLALQERQIAEADAFTPQNRFRVQTLDTGHSPFASQPQALAALLDAVS